MESALPRIGLCSLAPPVRGVLDHRENGTAFLPGCNRIALHPRWGESDAHAERAPATLFPQLSTGSTRSDRPDVGCLLARLANTLARFANDTGSRAA